MEWVGNNGCFGVDNQILNAMALGNPDRERYCSICLTQAPWVPRSSQQRISSFSPDIPNASEYAEVSSMEVGFRRKPQDTGTIRVGFTSNRSRKPVVASWTATPSSPSFRPKYHDRFSSIQPLAFLYSDSLALNALNQQVIKPWEQVGPHKYFSGQNNFSPWTHPCGSLPVTHSFGQALVHDLSFGRNTILGL